MSDIKELLQEATTVEEVVEALDPDFDDVYEWDMTTFSDRFLIACHGIRQVTNAYYAGRYRT